MRISAYRTAHFNAAHRLHNPNLSDKKNKEIFGLCNNPNYHGHNYDLEVRVTGEVDPETGFLIDLKILKKIIKQQIELRFDHKNIIFLVILCFLSCDNEYSGCDLFYSTREANAIHIQLLDSETEENLLFGASRKLFFDDLNILGIREDGTQEELLLIKEEIEGDSVLFIHNAYQNSFSGLHNEIIITYNSLYLEDTLKLDFAVADYCGDTPFRYDYNIQLNGELTCTLCARETFNIKK